MGDTLDPSRIWGIGSFGIWVFTPGGKRKGMVHFLGGLEYGLVMKTAEEIVQGIEAVARACILEDKMTVSECSAKMRELWGLASSLGLTVEVKTVEWSSSVLEVERLEKARAEVRARFEAFKKSRGIL